MTLFKRMKWWCLWKWDRTTQSEAKSEPILWDMTKVVKNLYPKPVMASDLLRLNELALKDDRHSAKAKLSVVDFAGNEIVGVIEDESDVAILAEPLGLSPEMHPFADTKSTVRACLGMGVVHNDG